jgi:penicillin-binding protein 1C
VKRRLKRAAALALFSAALLAASGFLVPLPARLRARDSRVIYFRDGSVAHAFLSSDQKQRLPVSIDRVDPRYLDALLQYEDHRFYRHPGVDPFALVRAAWQNLSAGKRRSGASTLTMQLVRMLEPRPRTFGNKIIESFRALQLTLRLSKREVLEAYLRFLPYGGNLEGVETASQRFFGHSARSLGPSEILTLLAVPQRPRQRAPGRDHRQSLENAMHKIGDQLDQPAGDPPVEVKPLPQLMPHAAYWLLARESSQEIHTTLDRSAQLVAERVLGAHRGALARDAIFNGAAVVIDHRAGEVRALVGNFDFFDELHHGQLPGFVVRRSPGSALKPFLYAQALDDGVTAPELLVEDVPLRWGPWAPANFDGHYQGLVRADDALARSLNTVFLRLLQQVGVDRFCGVLSQLELGDAAAALGRGPGLSLALGGIEVSPLELAMAFSALAEGGVYRRARVTQGDAVPAPVKIFSPGAAWLTRRALSLRNRPDSPAREISTVFWKTGTSYGQRDAWSVGADGDLAAAVWLGNFDRRPSPRLVGAQVAAPILFDLLDALRAPSTPPPPPPDLVPVEVCAISGHAPGPACDHKKRVLALRGHTRPPCPLHTTVEVDEEGEMLSPRCHERWAGKKTQLHHVMLLPAEVARVYRAPLDETAPAWARGCEPLAESHPRIASPAESETLLAMPGRVPVPLEVSGISALAMVQWFVDGKLLGAAAGSQRVFWQPQLGDHEIVAATAHRQRAARHVHVESF